MPSPPGAGHPLQTLTFDRCHFAALCQANRPYVRVSSYLRKLGKNSSTFDNHHRGRLLRLASVDTTRNLNGNSTSVMGIAPPKSRPSESGSKRASDGYPAKGGDVMDDFPMA